MTASNILIYITYDLCIPFRIWISSNFDHNESFAGSSATVAARNMRTRSHVCLISPLRRRRRWSRTHLAEAGRIDGLTIVLHAEVHVVDIERTSWDAYAVCNLIILLQPDNTINIPIVFGNVAWFAIPIDIRILLELVPACGKIQCNSLQRGWTVT